MCLEELCLSNESSIALLRLATALISNPFDPIWKLSKVAPCTMLSNHYKAIHTSRLFCKSLCAFVKSSHKMVLPLSFGVAVLQECLAGYSDVPYQYLKPETSIASVTNSALRHYSLEFPSVRSYYEHSSEKCHCSGHAEREKVAYLGEMWSTESNRQNSLKSRSFSTIQHG
jgi:hypothetical protein